jgi:hypothetical protein
MVSESGVTEGAQSAAQVQRFAVDFTERLFDPANPVLIEALARPEPERRHRCLVVVDDGRRRAGMAWLPERDRTR